MFAAGPKVAGVCQQVRSQAENQGKEDHLHIHMWQGRSRTGGGANTGKHESEYS